MRKLLLLLLILTSRETLSEEFKLICLSEEAAIVYEHVEGGFDSLSGSFDEKFLYSNDRGFRYFSDSLESRISKCNYYDDGYPKFCTHKAEGMEMTKRVEFHKNQSKSFVYYSQGVKESNGKISIAYSTVIGTCSKI